MKKRILTNLTFLLLLDILIVSVSAQVIAQAGVKTQVTCRRDWDCKRLDYQAQLESTRCVGQVHFFKMDDYTFRNYPQLFPILMGKPYTDEVQVAYKVHYGCNTEIGFCEVVRTEIVTERCQDRGLHGCSLETNKCICAEEPIETPKGVMYCNPESGPHVYYTTKTWKCETEERIAMYCGVGEKCADWPQNPELKYCADLTGEDAQELTQSITASSEGTKYVILFPKNPNQSIQVALIKNGRIIAERPISNMGALEYINKYGPVNAANAYAFAQKVGLTSLANSGSVSNRTPSTTFSTRKPATSTTFGSTGTLNSSYANVSGYRTISTYRNTYYNASNYSKSNYTPNSSYYRSTSYKPTTAYRSTYYRPSTTYTYKTYTKTYPTYSRYSYYNRYVSYKPYSTTSTYSSYSTGRYASYSRYNTARRISYSRYYYARRFS